MKKILKKKIINLRKKPPTMRMPNRIEKNLNKHFKDHWKKNFVMVNLLHIDIEGVLAVLQ